MKNTLYHVTLLLKRLGFILLLYSLCRVLFLLTNHSYFESADLLHAFLGGLRFDISAIALTNSPFILLSLIPLPWLQKTGYQRFLVVLLILLNLPCLLLNLIDTGYFPFTSQRSTSALFDMLLLSDDALTLLPKYLLDYWYLALGFILLVILMIRYLSRMDLSLISGKRTHYVSQSAALLLFAGLAVLGFRGGFQLRPMNNLSAMSYGRPQDVGLILNTPFSIISSYGKARLQRRAYFQEDELENIYSPVHHFSAAEGNKKNVMILIMESFSTEYVGKKNDKGLAFTPFLDSLVSDSHSFEHSYANGRRSLEALPSIMAGLPMMMSDPFITSSYAGTPLDGLPRILAPHGYSSAFFHGCTVGSMGFDKFCAAMGFEKYYGMEDYPHPKDYDGAWGIYDGPFFQFAADRIIAMPKPFFASIFSISSHHPYAIPAADSEEYKDFEPGLGRTVRYSDNALRNLFSRLKREDFFEHTIFVITADHIPNTEHPFFRTPLGSYSVPLIIFDPSHEFESSCSVAQHIDVQPTLCDYLGVQADFVGFGKSLITCEAEWMVEYLNDVYLLRKGDVMIRYDGENIVSIEHISDPDMPVDPIDEIALLRELQAIIQQYTNRMIDNKMSIVR